MRGGSEKDTLFFFISLTDSLQALLGVSVTHISAVCRSRLARCCVSAITQLLRRAATEQPAFLTPFSITVVFSDFHSFAGKRCGGVGREGGKTAVDAHLNGFL